jgi:hypothetical protein
MKAPSAMANAKMKAGNFMPAVGFDMAGESDFSAGYGSIFFGNSRLRIFGARHAVTTLRDGQKTGKVTSSIPLYN